MQWRNCRRRRSRPSGPGAWPQAAPGNSLTRSCPELRLQPNGGPLALRIASWKGVAALHSAGAAPGFNNCRVREVPISPPLGTPSSTPGSPARLSMAEVFDAAPPTIRCFDCKPPGRKLLEVPSSSDLSTTSSDEYIRAEPSAKAARLEGQRSCSFTSPRAPKPAQPGWSPAQSAEVYNLSGWGAPYFSVNSRGNLAVSPAGEGRPHAGLWGPGPRGRRRVGRLHAGWCTHSGPLLPELPGGCRAAPVPPARRGGGAGWPCAGTDCSVGPHRLTPHTHCGGAVHHTPDGPPTAAAASALPRPQMAPAAWTSTSWCRCCMTRACARRCWSDSWT